MSPRLAVFAISLIAAAASAHAESDKEKEERVLAAIAACDKGASAPLDPTATAPPIQFSELFSPTFDLGPLRAVVEACRIAAEGRPDVVRLRLQRARAEIALGERFDPALAARVRSLAREGMPEANFLLFAIHRSYADAGIDLAEGQAGLRAAAEAGHRDALLTIVEEYRYGPYFRRDPHEAARFAGLLAELPKQGIGSPTAADTEAMATGLLVANGLPLMSDAFSPKEQQRAFSVIRDRYEKGEPGAFIPYTTALRFGRGTEADPESARGLLEDAVADNNAALS